MERKEIESLGWKHIGGNVYTLNEGWYLFGDPINRWSIYEKLSDCLNRDENFGIAINFTIKSVDELKMVMRMADVG